MRYIALYLGYCFFLFLTVPQRICLGFCGRNVYLSPFIRIKGVKHIRIGDNVRLVGRGYIQGRGGITIGSNCSIASGVSILTLEHKFRGATKLPYDRRRICKSVHIGSQVWIGRNVILLPGSRIGEGVIIGAGSVVHGVIPPLSIIAGNPAREIGQRDREEYEHLKTKKSFFSIQDIINNGWKMIREHKE